MEAEERRNKIVELLANGTAPISGSELSRLLGVSRQVIVQDIALLRANNKNILSTTKGYVLYIPESVVSRCRRTVAVNHGDERMLEELCLIIDLGGTVLDVVVEHDVYGQLTGELQLSSRQDIVGFMERIERSRSQSLLTLTCGDHYHTIEASNEAVLDRIELTLREKGFLIE